MSLCFFRQPRKNHSTVSQDSWYTSSEGIRPSRNNSRLSVGQSSHNGYLGRSNFNARVLLETQELLRQEQRRREQEASKDRPSPAQDTHTGSVHIQGRDHSQAPSQSKGPYSRQDVPPSPTQLAKLSKRPGSEKGRFYSWDGERPGLKQVFTCQRYQQVFLIRYVQTRIFIGQLLWKYIF